MSQPGSPVGSAPPAGASRLAVKTLLRSSSAMADKGEPHSARLPLPHNSRAPSDSFAFDSQVRASGQ